MCRRSVDGPQPGYLVRIASVSSSMVTMTASAPAAVRSSALPGLFANPMLGAQIARAA
jgi:hypothetical protein